MQLWTCQCKDRDAVTDTSAHHVCRLHSDIFSVEPPQAALSLTHGRETLHVCAQGYVVSHSLLPCITVHLSRAFSSQFVTSAFTVHMISYRNRNISYKRSLHICRYSPHIYKYSPHIYTVLTSIDTVLTSINAVLTSIYTVHTSINTVHASIQSSYL